MMAVVGCLATFAIGVVILVLVQSWTSQGGANQLTHATDADAPMTESPPSIASADRNESGASGQAAIQPAAAGSLLAHATPRPTAAESGAALRVAAKRQARLDEKVIPFLQTHCADCHSTANPEGGIAIDKLSTVSQLLSERKKWERVYRMISAGAMPPSDYEPRPTDDLRTEIAGILDEELFNFDCTEIHHAGRPTLHRLNRAEYNNTIRDLFGLTITPADEFPQDDVGEGFDNVGDVLSLPPLLMEKYLDAAETVATAVIDTRDFSNGNVLKFEAERFSSTLGGEPNEDGYWMLLTNGAVSITADGLQEGRYTIRIEAAATQAGDEDAKMALVIDGQRVREFDVRGHRQEAWHEHDVTLTAGSHTIAAEFLNDYFNDQEENRRRRDRNLAVRAIEIRGPEGGSQPAWHETHKRFVTARPSETVSVRQAAATVLRPILYRGFRRPVSDAEVDRFAGLVEATVTEQGDSYEQGLSLALQAMLVSTDFLFRNEADPADGTADRDLNDYEVASRLSYFLWSSMPDEELFQLAENKRLLDRAILRQQIERMLRDEKALALGRNFAAQWLNLRNLAEVQPNPDVFPDFDDELRAAMGRETELLFNTIVRENRSVDDFLTADFTFVNERLAKHYGISGVAGSEFTRVSLEGQKRSGVLTHASILTLTSNPGRTSPVKRGKWILENILGEAPPPAPPGVPLLEEATKDVSGLSLRERLEAHRKDPGCASCHKTMDPLGMGLENFDAIGRWRDQESDKPVDASGDLPSGERFSGPIELIQIVRSREDRFHRTLTERLMVYALGRGLEYYDKCAVDETLLQMKQRGNRFSALVEGIVTSDAFLKRSRNREADVAKK